MLRLIDRPDAYSRLDAAQLVKHAFGLAHTFRSTPVALLYLYWEPDIPDGDPVFQQHRDEIDDFSSRVAGSTPLFEAMSYPELWDRWGVDAPEWLRQHLGELAARYTRTL